MKIQQSFLGDTGNKELVEAKKARRAEKPPAARSSDPMSSHLAALNHGRSGKAESNRQRVTDLVYQHPGLTSKQLATHCEDLDRSEIARRLPECEDRGLVVSQGRETKKEITWWPPGQ